MAIVNVKVGSLEVPMDLELNADIRANIQYIGKVLGFPPEKLRNASYSSSPVPPHVGLGYDLRKKGEINPFPGGKSLKGAGIHEHLASAGESQSGLPFPKAQTIELFDPSDPSLEPDYPMDRFGSNSIPNINRP